MGLPRRRGERNGSLCEAVPSSVHLRRPCVALIFRNQQKVDFVFISSSLSSSSGRVIVGQRANRTHHTMTLVLTKAELDRMRANIRGPQNDTTVADRKAEMKRMSNERMKNWPNTLEALRLKKESWLKDKADKEELQRQEIDRHEAELRRIQRLEAIHKANDLLFEQTDKVKMMRSQQLYADVVYTRQQQADYKNQQKAKAKELESEFHQNVLRQVAEAEAIEQRKLDARQRAIEEVKVSRFEQREAARLRKEEELRKNREEGERIKKGAQEELQEELRNMEKKQKHAAESNLRMLKANSDLKQIRLDMQEQERLAGLERDKEVEQIDHRKTMLKHLAQVRFEKSQETRQMMIDAAVKKLAEQQNHEEAILEKQVQNLKDKEDAVIAAKAARQEAIKKDIIESRTAQIEARERKERQQFDDDDVLVQRWRLENEEGIRAEEEKAKQRRQATVQIKTKQYNDGKEAARKKEEAKLMEIEQAKYLATIENSDDTRFVELCKAKIEENVRLGKPIYTLLRALDFHGPELLAAKTVKVTKKKDE
jgi:hypothetical protein